MTPHFTTPCFVRIEDADKRKEVCKKLYSFGYLLGQHSIDALDDAIVTFPEVAGTFCTISSESLDDGDNDDLMGWIGCSTNIELFLALAAMRDDTDKGQWHVAQTNIMFKKLKGEVATASKKRYITIGEMFMPLNQNLRFTWLGGNPKQLFRRATAAEIIEHFNAKEK